MVMNKERERVELEKRDVPQKHYKEGKIEFINEGRKREEER